MLINAGQANAATGDAGYEDSVKSAEAVAQALGIESDQVLIESTGISLHATCCNYWYYVWGVARPHQPVNA